MKKTSVLLSSLMLLGVLSACSGNNTSNAPAPSTTPSTENSGGTTPGTAEPAQPDSSANASAEETKITNNKKLVTGLYNDVLNSHKLDQAEQYLAEGYVEHTPAAANGREGFAAYYAALFQKNADYKVNVRGMLGQGDLVAVFSEPAAPAGSSADTATQASSAPMVDMYRIADNKIAEHWSVKAANLTGSEKPADLLPTPSTEAVVADTPRATVAANANFVKNFYDAFFNSHNADAANEAVSENVIQHGSGIANGRDALTSHYLIEFRAHADSTAIVTNVIAEGDLVLVYSQMQNSADDRGNAVVHIFCVENGQIAEMWTLSQPVPENPANDNTMF
ncbi:nuclear transport factor 2 family protein [Paenibacillus dauci]|uniref:nuclear transport factor 2 family protein n=1 Tax=Paenibacillus dauci TaxID=1567106 RepID=UPI000697C8C9|nr:nuclear transport factor 2 family protein [Paenibacillus dauci]